MIKSDWPWESDMHPLRINLITGRSSYSIASWLLLVAGVTVFASALFFYYSATQQRIFLQAQLADESRVPQQARRSQVQAENAPISKPGLRVLTHLGQPWEQWFVALETSNDSNVAVLGFDMKGDPAQLRLNAEARHMRDALAYVKALRSLPTVGTAVLSSHEVVRVGVVDVLRFTVELGWNKTP